MHQFWESASIIAHRAGQPEAITRLKSGILAAVATYKVMEALGKHPRLSHPEQDAYDAIDLLIDTGAVQVKSDREAEAVVERTDSVDFPGVRLDSPERTRHFSVQTDNPAMDRFRTGVDHYAQQLGRPVEGYFIRIPRRMIDPHTGRPTQALIEQIRTKIDV